MTLRRHQAQNPSLFQLRNFKRALVAAGIATSVLVSCSSAQDQAGTDQILDVLSGGEEFSVLVANERSLYEERIYECMADRGFEYEIPAPAPSSNHESDDPPTVGWGIVEGFSQALGDEAATPTERSPSDANALRPEELAFDQALRGSSGTTGCSQIARAVSTPTTELIDEIERLSAEQAEAFKSSKEFISSLQNWQACMAQAGFNVESPTEIPLLIEQEVFENLQDLTTAYDLEELLFQTEKACPRLASPDLKELAARIAERLNS